MYYRITAYNTGALYAWSDDESKVARYVAWLNRNREINLYGYEAIGETSPEDEPIPLEDRDDVLDMTEPYWDDFMDEDA